MENKFTSEQIEKIRNCKTVEEAKDLAEKENIALTDEELKAITGGGAFYSPIPEYGLYGSSDPRMRRLRGDAPKTDKGK